MTQFPRARCGHSETEPRRSANEMNRDQQNNLTETADAIGDQLSWTWNYIATLRELQKHARSHPELIERNNHFFLTITRAMWDALFLKLSHCSDDSKKGRAMGFPKLFKQLRAYKPNDPILHATVKKQEGVLRCLSAKRKVEKWRDEVLAHHTQAATSSDFYQQNKCTLEEVEKLVAKYQRILHAFTFPLLNLGFRIRDHGPRAHRGVKQLFTALERGPTTRSTRTAHRGAVSGQ